jgi:hypothetical protein
MSPQRFLNPQVCHDWAMNYLNSNGFSNVTASGQALAVGKKLSAKAILFCTPTAELAIVISGPDIGAIQNIQNAISSAPR